MSIHKVIQKHDKQFFAEFEQTRMAPIVSDTVCTVDGGDTKWQVIYTILEDKEPKVVEVMATADDATPSNLQFKDIACSFLHRIATRATLLPYTNMIRWVLDKSVIKDR